MIELDLLGDAPVEIGGSVRVRVRWAGVERAVREIRVSIAARVVVGDEVHEVPDARTTVATPLDSPEGSVEVELETPTAGPPTYRGRLFSVEWGVSAVVDLPRARDVVISGPVLEVVPRGTALLEALGRADPPPADGAAD